jgi:parvulin-like peptidyl-prolyl isomerase
LKSSEGHKEYSGKKVTNEDNKDNDDKNNKLISDKIDEDFNKNINQEYLNDKLIPAELINLLAIMNKNDITRPIKINNNWHIVKLFDYRFMKIPSFEEVKEKLVSEINNNIKSDLEQEILSGAKIEYKYLKR